MDDSYMVLFTLYLGPGVEPLLWVVEGGWTFGGCEGRLPLLQFAADLLFDGAAEVSCVIDDNPEE